MFGGTGSSGIVDWEAGLVIPGHPVAGVLEDGSGIFLKGHQVVERIDAPQIAGVNQAHEHITDERAVFGLVEERVFPVEDGLFQGLLTDVVVQGRLGGSWASRRMKAIRFSFINIPGRIVERSGELIVRLVKGHPALELFLEARRRIMAMTPVYG